MTEKETKQIEKTDKAESTDKTEDKAKAKKAANALLTALALMLAKRSGIEGDEHTVCFTVYLSKGKGETGPVRVFKGRTEGHVEIVGETDPA